MTETDTEKMKMKMCDAFKELKEGHDKLSTEEHAIIAMMCLSKLHRKVKELKDLYNSLAKTYGFELGTCDITCIAQISAKPFETPMLTMLGTDEGIQKGLNELKVGAAKHDFKLGNEEESNDKE